MTVETLAITFSRRCGHKETFVPQGDPSDSSTLGKLRSRDCLACCRACRVSKGKLLVQVARGLAQPFSIEELVIAAWTSYPKDFGMAAGNYPCSHRVSGVLFGSGGPIAKGWMERVSKSHYRLTGDSYLVGKA